MKLTFRERGISRSARRRILLLLLIFAGSLVLFYLLRNVRPEKQPVEMTDPTLPTITVDAAGTTVGELHGYTTEMNTSYMRDSVIPVESTKIMPIHIASHGEKITDLSYEIRSLDTSRKIAETNIDDLTEDGDTITAKPKLENLLSEGEEYLMILKLKADGTQLYYYARILIPTDDHAKSCVDFALYFHNTALSDTYSELGDYLETSAYADTNTLSDVTIESTLNQVGWSGFHGTQVADPQVKITDITSDYTSVVLTYQMHEDASTVDDEIASRQSRESGTSLTQETDASDADASSDETSAAAESSSLGASAGTSEDGTYYNVTEYFKIRYGGDRMYLLDYQRTMDQILDPSDISVDGNEISLGITGSDLNYISNETGEIVAFEEGGSLYEYNQNTKQMTCIFSFYHDGNYTDSRASFGEHGIRLIHIDEAGGLDFIVYGYMNAGEHEGSCGMDLYHYDSNTNHATEQAFVSAKSSYEILNANFSDLIYMNQNGVFFIMMDGTLIRVDTGHMVTTELLSGYSDDRYAASESGRYLAYIKKSDASDVLYLMDLEKETTTEISAASGEWIRPVAFMEDDLVYGFVRESDISTDIAGSSVYPMYDLQIVSAEDPDTVLKDYQPEGKYITDAVKADGTLYLSRAVKTADGYEATDGDTIRNSAGETNKAVAISHIADTTYGSLTILTMTELSNGNTVTSVNGAYAELIPADSRDTIEVSASSAQARYYVYVGSRVIDSGSSLADMIGQADSQMGIVIDNEQHYIWKRTKSQTKSALTGLSVEAADASSSGTAKAISAMLNHEGETDEVGAKLAEGSTPLKILSSDLEDKLVLDLTGCQLSQVLYYVNLGNPVYARVGENDADLIVGYDASTVSVYNPRSGTLSQMPIETAEAQFAAAGSVYISYVDQ